jgi:hypothetical protein
MTSGPRLHSMVLALAGIVAFVRVIILDLVVGFRAVDNVESALCPPQWRGGTAEKEIDS